MIYEVQCNECPSGGPGDPHSTYLGTSGTNIHHRSLLHLRDISGKTTSKYLYKHNIKYHNDTHTQSDKFKFKTVYTHPSIMNSILTEAYSITNRKTQLMNSKYEYEAGKFYHVI